MAKSANCSIDMPHNTCQGDKEFSEQSPLASSIKYSSQASSIDTNSENVCRICREGVTDLPLITTCYCRGSLRYVHQTCLQQWIKYSAKRYCNICNFQYITQTEMKPCNEWQCLPMIRLERKIFGAWVLFFLNLLALTALTKLVPHTILDAHRRDRILWLCWISYTVLIIVGIGLLYVTVRILLRLHKIGLTFWKRWIVLNRVTYVQEVPKESIATSDRDTTKTKCSVKRTDSNKPNMENMPETNCIDIKTDQSQVKSKIKNGQVVIEFEENCSVEYFDCEKVADKLNELPASKLFITDDVLPFDSRSENCMENGQSCEDPVGVDRVTE